MGIKKSIRLAINSLLSYVGLELIRTNRTFQDYIPIEETLAGAKEAGMSIGDYIDEKFNIPGATQETIDKMAELGVFDHNIERVCEIGPGSGRYLEKMMNACNPDYYEIYETAIEWQNWLVKNYGVTAQETDGKTLKQTPTNSIDLVHTHKMLYAQPVLTICTYFSEMARVVRGNGKIVFDILTEDCLNDDMLEKWLDSGVRDPASMIGKQYAINYFQDRDFSFNGAFKIPMLPGITEYLVFSSNNKQ